MVKKTAIIHTNSVELHGMLPKWCLLNSQSKLENMALINFSNSNLRTGSDTTSSNLSDVAAVSYTHLTLPTKLSV